MGSPPRDQENPSKLRLTQLKLHLKSSSKKPWRFGCDRELAQQRSQESIRNKGHFPSGPAASKLIWPALRNITAKWKNPPIA